MKKLFLSLCSVVALGSSSIAMAQVQSDSTITALTTIDSNIVKFFPRWKICEPNIQSQIVQAFRLLGKNNGNMNITVVAAPLKDPNKPDYTLLSIQSGSESLNATEIEANIGKLAAQIRKKDYCAQDIPPSVPPTPPETEAIINYKEPTNVRQSISLSAFEQSVKIGSSGFWLRSSLGTDQIGSHFWSSGEGRITIQRPLINNDNPEYAETQSAIPYLMNVRLGVSYRITGGLDNNFLEFLPKRKLNVAYGGKLVAGIDFHMPFHPQAGIAVNMELPLQALDNQKGVDFTTYANYLRSLDSIGTTEEFNASSKGLWTEVDGKGNRINAVRVAPVLRSTGQVTAFYNWWLENDTRPQNFIRADIGVSYAEVRETAFLGDISSKPNEPTRGISTLGLYGITGLRTWKPNEFLDWIYARVEYRHQSAKPFGVALQLSNQTLLATGYVPLFGNWFYLEGKFSTVLRTVRPYEIGTFFMISPVLRLNI